MIELVRDCLSRPDFSARVAEAGRPRCLPEHLWIHRFQLIGWMLGFLSDPGPGQSLLRSALGAAPEVPEPPKEIARGWRA